MCMRMHIRQDAEQYHDHETDTFHMRIQFTSHIEAKVLQNILASFMEAWSMQWSLHDANEPMRTVIFCSKEGHCLNDLL